MERLLRLPPGFRFHPTDEELVVDYLTRKALSCILPAAIIPEIDLGKCDPWDLPGRQEEERYFFNLQEAKYRKGNRSNRSTRAGFWKATGKDRPVRSSKSGELVGVKKVLVFYQGKAPHGVRTHWIMHEYRLVSPEISRKNSIQCASVQGKNWVVCRIFKKKRASNMDDHEDIPYLYNDPQTQNHGNFGPQCPSSSCVTDLSDEEYNSGEEASSKP